VENIKRDSKNPFFKSKYASLANVLDTIRVPLKEAGLAFSQLPTGDNELATLLMHSSGEYLMSVVKMSPLKNEPQAIGSAITYMRRYSLASVLGLNIDDDDDGNLASTPLIPKR
jgi:hypothetical protein